MQVLLLFHKRGKDHSILKLIRTSYELKRASQVAQW